MDPPQNKPNSTKTKRNSNFWNRTFNSRGRINKNSSNESPVSFILPQIPVQTGSQPPITLMLDSIPDKYPGWKLYIPQEAYMTGSSTVQKIEAIENHIKENQSFYDIESITELLWFPFKIKDLQNDETFLKNYTNFHQELCEKPEYFLACMGLAMHQTILNSSEFPDLPSKLMIHKTCLRIRPRILGFEPLMKLNSLKTSKIGRLVSVKGTVMRVGGAQLFYTWIVWQCGICRAEQVVRQTDNITSQPQSCTSEKCRAKSQFIPVECSRFTVSEFIQNLKLQESFLGRESGRIPLNIDIVINQDMVDCVNPGDEVTVTGILKVRAQEENQKKVLTHIYKMNIEAVSLTTSKNAFTKKETQYTEKDLELIETITNQPCPFRLLVHSLCPSIFGHEMVKAGLVLGLFGGGTDLTERRSEVHVLVVGDPGVGKSQMLLACSNVSPRGVLVCGDSSSQAGLTVAIRQEKGGGSGSVEAGALVLANQGTCCIDEFDKMAANHKVLLDVMEQQTVSIAKAGVLCSFPAKTSILAVANPTGGHYNKGKTVAENLKMGNALLSRFDLVFILMDNADENLDRLITMHNQTLRSGRKNLTPSYSSYISNPDHLNESDSTVDDSKIPLEQRLKLLPDEKMDYLPQLLMQKYIGESLIYSMG